MPARPRSFSTSTVIPLSAAGLLALMPVLGVSQDEGAPPAPPADPKPEVKEVIGSDGVERRNPRKIREQRGESEGPRMVAGGFNIEDDGLPWYNLLEPMIGRFSFTGVSWRVPGAEPSDFTGMWSNEWALDGQYMQTEFTIEGGRRPFTAIGMTCYDIRNNRFEAHFFNTNSAVRSFRYGDFDAESRILSMESRTSNQPEGAEPEQKYAFEIVSDDEFIYRGWTYNGETKEWWMSYEMTLTRIVVEPDTAKAGDGATSDGGKGETGGQ